MPDETTPPNNFDRLLKLLKEKSLAASLLQAHRDPTAGSPMDSMIAVLKARLEQVRKDLDHTQN